jgi:hypothetical protein
VNPVATAIKTEVIKNFFKLINARIIEYCLDKSLQLIHIHRNFFLFFQFLSD